MVDTFAPDSDRLVIDRYTQRVPVDVSAVARELGLTVRRSDADDFAGKILKELPGSRISPAGYTIYINGRDPHRRQRFTLAHEIGHYFLHRDLIGDGLVDDGLYRSKLGEWYERQANRFAADLLMPAGIVRGLYRGGMVALAHLSQELDVSESAVRIRLQELGLG